MYMGDMVVGEYTMLWSKVFVTVTLTVMTYCLTVCVYYSKVY
jgi:hypothetical protein